jgi:hypothetical protein
MSSNSSMDERRLHALLPSYVNSTASLADRQWIKNLLSQSAQARVALAWHESLAEKVINDIEAAPSDIGWAELHARVRTSSVRAPDPAHTRTAPASTPWMRQLLEKLESLMPHRWMPAPALGGVCAALVAVVVGQAAFFSSHSSQEFSEVRGERTSTGVGAMAGGASDSRYVRLNFKEKITERDMRLLLVRTGAVIVSGPGQLGDYTVAIPAEELIQALKQFQDSLLTESVQQVSAPTTRATDKSGTTGAAPNQSGVQQIQRFQ